MQIWINDVWAVCLALALFFVWTVHDLTPKQGLEDVSEGFGLTLHEYLITVRCSDQEKAGFYLRVLLLVWTPYECSSIF